MDELTLQPTRQRIVEEVAHHPGLSGRELQQRLILGWGETAYHLERLVRAGAVRRERGGWRDYYFASDVTWDDRKLHQSLRSPTERAILIALARKERLTFRELGDELEVGKSTVSFHLNLLIERGTVLAEPSPEGRRYRAQRPDRVRELLRAYRVSFQDRLVDQFVASFSGLLRE